MMRCRSMMCGKCDDSKGCFFSLKGSRSETGASYAPWKIHKRLKARQRSLLELKVVPCQFYIDRMEPTQERRERGPHREEGGRQRMKSRQESSRSLTPNAIRVTHANSLLHPRVQLVERDRQENNTITKNERNESRESTENSAANTPTSGLGLEVFLDAMELAEAEVHFLSLFRPPPFGVLINFLKRLNSVVFRQFHTDA
ncbi:hypothetical protein IWZ01DRAFT_347148 [Phyllosticta capitalensis]